MIGRKEAHSQLNKNFMDFSLQEKYEQDMNDWKEAQLKELQVQQLLT